MGLDQIGCAVTNLIGAEADELGPVGDALSLFDSLMSGGCAPGGGPAAGGGCANLQELASVAELAVLL